MLYTVPQRSSKYRDVRFTFCCSRVFARLMAVSFYTACSRHLIEPLLFLGILSERLQERDASSCRAIGKFCCIFVYELITLGAGFITFSRPRRLIQPLMNRFVQVECASCRMLLDRHVTGSQPPFPLNPDPDQNRED